MLKTGDFSKLKDGGAQGTNICFDSLQTTVFNKTFEQTKLFRTSFSDADNLDYVCVSTSTATASHCCEYDSDINSLTNNTNKNRNRNIIKTATTEIETDVKISPSLCSDFSSFTSSATTTTSSPEDATVSFVLSNRATEDAGSQQHLFLSNLLPGSDLALASHSITEYSAKKEVEFCDISNVTVAIKSEHGTSENNNQNVLVIKDDQETDHNHGNVNVRQALELGWLKPKGKSSIDLDILNDMDSKTASSSLPIIDASSSFPDNINDFVFAASLPSENAMVKSDVGGDYFEVLEGGHFHYTSETTPHIAWSAAQSDNSSTVTALGHLSCATETFVSFADDALEESVSSSGVMSCNTNDLNSILFDTMSHDTSKPDSLPAEIMNYADNLNFTIDSTLACSEETVSNCNQISPSDLPPTACVPVTYSKIIVHPVLLRQLNDSTRDLNSLPNFLSLEESSSSDNNLENNSVSVFVGNSPETLQTNQTISKHLPESVLTDADNNQDSDQDVSITTISITNDEENATKILVDTPQGQQHMYVFNTSDLSKRNYCNVNQGNVLLLNTSDLEGRTFSINVLDSGVTTENVVSVASNPVQQLSVGTPNLAGLVLMPVVEAQHNLARSEPAQSSPEGTNGPKRPLKVYVCSSSGCRKTFKKASKLKVHQMRHTGERPFKCSLLGCEWAFTTSNKLKRHLESHEGRKDYFCDKPGCGHRFTTVYNLNNHRKLHDRPCTEVCMEEGCGQKFATKRQLDLHLRNVHACEDRTFKCPEPGCEKTFFSSGCMGSHMKVHQLNQEELKCKVPGCGKEFTKMCRLRQHERLHSGERPFLCDFQGCNWAFATASKLKRHQTKHTGLRKWVCGVCMKQFHRSEHLKGHLITHSGDRPFICPVEGCGNTFTAKSSLYVHLKKHDESGKTIVYHCPMEKCEKHYANKASLRQHILVKHCNMSQADNTVDGNSRIIGWLSLLGPGDASGDMNLPQDPCQEGLEQNQEPELATDFLTADMAGEALVASAADSLQDPNLQSQMMPRVVCVGPASPDVAGPLAADVPAQDAQQDPFQPPPLQQQHVYFEEQIDPNMAEAGQILQQERLTFAAERGKKSQIMLENTLGSARTDPRSNNIISQRSLKRWQEQKEVEAGKLRVKLESANQFCVVAQVSVDGIGDFKNVSPISLEGQRQVQTVFLHRAGLNRLISAAKDLPDLELQAEGLPSLSLSGPATDSFMTELFIRDPETGMTYRQTQLLQDDPPNPDLLEDVTSCDSMITLEPSLDAQFVEDSLSFQHLE